MNVEKPFFLFPTGVPEQRMKLAPAPAFERPDRLTQAHSAEVCL